MSKFMDGIYRILCVLVYFVALQSIAKFIGFEIMVTIALGALLTVAVECRHNKEVKDDCSKAH